MPCKMIRKNKLLTFVLIRICDRILRRINAFVAVMLKRLAFRCDVTDLNFPEPQPSNPIFLSFFFSKGWYYIGIIIIF